MNDQNINNNLFSNMASPSGNQGVVPPVTNQSVVPPSMVPEMNASVNVGGVPNNGMMSNGSNGNGIPDMNNNMISNNMEINPIPFDLPPTGNVNSNPIAMGNNNVVNPGADVNGNAIGSFNQELNMNSEMVNQVPEFNNMNNVVNNGQMPNAINGGISLEQGMNLGINVSPVVDGSASTNQSVGIENTLNSSISNPNMDINASTDINAFNMVNEVENVTMASEEKVTNNEDNNIVSVLKYLGHMLLFGIPVVGFIMLIVKAFSKKDKNISNYAKAQLLFSFIVGIFMVAGTIAAIPLIVNYVNDNPLEFVDDEYNSDTNLGDDTLNSNPDLDTDSNVESEPGSDSNSVANAGIGSDI